MHASHKVLLVLSAFVFSSDESLAQAQERTAPAGTEINKPGATTRSSASSAAPIRDALSLALEDPHAPRPGNIGVAVERRSRKEFKQKLKELTKLWGVEVALTYVDGPGKSGGGGRYYLHSGDQRAVFPPKEPDRMVIYHTQPTGTPEASGGDRDSLRDNKDLRNPQRVSRVIPVGEERELPGILTRILPATREALAFDERTPSADLVNFLERHGIPVASNREIRALEDPKSKWKPPFVALTHASDWDKVRNLVLNENTLSDARRFDRIFSKLGFDLPVYGRFFVARDGHLVLANLGQMQIPINYGGGKDSRRTYDFRGYKFRNGALFDIASATEEAISWRQANRGQFEDDLKRLAGRSFRLDGTPVISSNRGLNRDNTLEVMTNQAESIVAKLEQDVKRLIPTTGLPSVGALRKLALSRGAGGQQALTLLQDDGFQLAMNRPIENRESIVGHGFQSVHVTGLTQGARTNGGSINIRNLIEASYLDMPLEAYTNLDSRLRPQYGYLRPKPIHGLRGGFVGYGGDTYIFKPSRVKRFLTLCPGDSLNRWRDGEGRDSMATVATKTARPRSWDQLYIPWKLRHVIAPQVGISDLGVVTVEEASKVGMQSQWGPAETYFELQYWKPDLNLEDIQAFEFSGVPPAGDFLKALRSHKIKIYRKGETEAWKEDVNDTRGAEPAARAAATSPLLRRWNARQTAKAKTHPQLYRLLDRPEQNGDQIMQYFAQVSHQVRTQLDKPAMVTEGYSIRAHTQRVYAKYHDQWRFFPFHQVQVALRTDLKRTLRAAIALHDIGKYLAFEKTGLKGEASQQHRYTLPILSKALLDVGLTIQEIKLARALVGHDFIGGVAQKTISVDAAESSLRKLADQVGMPARDFFLLNAFLFTIDAASYPTVEARVFHRTEEGQLVMKPENQPFYQLAERFGVTSFVAGR